LWARAPVKKPDCAIHFSLTKRTKSAFICAFPTFVTFVTFVDSEEMTGALGSARQEITT